MSIMFSALKLEGNSTKPRRTTLVTMQDVCGSKSGAKRCSDHLELEGAFVT